MKIKPVLTAALVVVLAAGVSASAFILPTPVAQQTPEADYVPVGQTFSLACAGGGSRTVAEGVSVSTEPENLSARGAVFVDGARWFSLNQHSDSRSLTVVSSPASDIELPEMAGVVYASDDDIRGGHIMGASAITVGGGDMRGLAVNPCTWTAQSAWLVGSSTQVGTYNVLRVVNPGDNSLTLTLAAYGENGPLDLGSAQHMQVAPQTTSELNLDGLVPEVEQLALQVTSDSGVFSASLQTNALDGFTPRGVSFVSPANLGTDFYVPGVVVSKPSDDAEAGAASPSTTTLRLVNPQDTETTVYVSVVGESEEKLAGLEETALPPQSVLDLTLDDLAPGSYAIHLTSSAPVTAGVKTALATDTFIDHAWIGAQSLLKAGGAAVVGDAQLVVTAPASSSVTVTGYDSHGKKGKTTNATVSGTQEVEIPEGSDFVWVTASTPVAAAIYSTQALNNGNGVAITPLTAQGSDSQSYQVNVLP